MKRFGSLRGVKEAKLEELKGAPGMTEGVAEKLWGFLHPSDQSGRTDPSD